MFVFGFAAVQLAMALSRKYRAERPRRWWAAFLIACVLIFGIAAGGQYLFMYSREEITVPAEVDMVLLLDASGTSLNQILYFVSQGCPVLANTDVDRWQYLTGYDQSHVRIWDPLTEQSETLTLDAANERFGRSGNDFICCIYRK